MQISKTEFILYLNCPKSLWLLKHKRDVYPDGEFSDYAKKIAAEGYEVEDYVRDLLNTQPDADTYSFQSEFLTERGLYARADVTRDNGNGTIDLYEVKSSTSVKKSGQRNQIKDAAFQKIAAEEAGHRVSRVFIVHLNKNYVKLGEINPGELLEFTDVTSDVAEIEDETRAEINSALTLLDKQHIDESFCSCLELTRLNHCDAFEYFNPDLPEPSIYNLPRISKSKITGFVADGRFDLDEIGLDEVTQNQAPVLRSAQLRKPVIEQSVLANFYNRAQYPIYFLDYETYSSAIPLVDGVRPQAPIPFQYSLHVIRDFLCKQLLSAVKVNGHPSPRNSFGMLYGWLFASRLSKNPGPIRDIVRDVIIEHVPLVPGQMLLGQHVTTPRLASVTSIASAEGLHSKTLTKILRLAGVIDGALPLAGARNVVADYALAKPLIERAKHATPVTRVPEMLSASRPMVAALIALGKLRRIQDHDELQSKVGKAIDGRSIHDVLKFIERSFDTIDEVPEGHVHLAKAAEKTHVTMQAILEMLFGLHLKTARLLAGKHGFSGVMVSPTEIMECIADPPEGASDEIRFWMP